MRYWIALGLVLSLAGCKTIQEVRSDADDAKCTSYGAVKGTPEYTQCRVALEAANRNAAATAGVSQAINNQAINQTLYQGPPQWLHRP